MFKGSKMAKQKQGEPQIKIKQLEERVAGLEDQLKRAVADYRNLENRVQIDGAALADYSKTNLVKRLLPVLDSLDQAVEGAIQSEADSAWLKGVMMSIKQLRQVLVEEGLLEIDVSETFNPNLHEAVEVKEGEDGKVLETVQRGYTLNGKVVRPARVVVGKDNPVKISKEAEKEVETGEV